MLACTDNDLNYWVYTFTTFKNNNSYFCMELLSCSKVKEGRKGEEWIIIEPCAKYYVLRAYVIISWQQF